MKTCDCRLELDLLTELASGEFIDLRKLLSCLCASHVVESWVSTR